MEVVVKGAPKIEVSFNTDLGLRNKADKQGVYPDLIAGDLAGHGESVPAEFSFRASGGKSIKDGMAYIKRIKGNSVVWNQQVDTITPQDCELSETDNRLTLTPQGAFPGVKNVESMNIIENHVYICISHRIGGGFLNVNCGGYDSDTNVPFSAKKRDYGFTVYYYGESQPITITRPILIDLTQMFGAGNEPTTIEEFNARKPIVADEYAYNEGEVIHCNTESIKSVGDNAFNGVWYQGGVSDNDGSIITTQPDNLHTDTFRVIGGETYCSQYDGADLYLKGFFFDKAGAFIGSSDFDVWQGTKKWVAPINADSVRMRLFNGVGNITPSQAPNVMITLVHSGWKQDTDAGYQEYWEDTLPLSIIRKYFPDGIRSAGSAHDEIRFNKATNKWEKVVRIGSVDLGTLDWWHNNEGRMIAALAYGVFNKVLDNKPANAICAQYPIETYIHVYTNNYGLALSYQEPYLYVTVFDSAYTDAATFKAAMQGVILYYELAEPIVTEITDSFRDYYNVADFGTEQMLAELPSAPFSADIIYQFNAVDMIREHELEITELQKVIATMQAQLTSLTNGGQ